MKTRNRLSFFAISTLQLILLVGMTGFIHWSAMKYLKFHLSEELFIRAYLFNFGIAFLLVSLSTFFKEKILPHLGYSFLVFSSLKLILFFLLLYPDFKTEYNLKSIQFATFFIPYAVCLVYEIHMLIKLIDMNEKQ